ncbi:MAG: DUF1016 N-terminal domain-containing protein [Flavonifractor plautii]
MNIRKPSDYSSLYSPLDVLMGSDLAEMELYCEIGRAVCGRTEKGAAVMAAEYLQSRYPERKGFSPRNLRRMRLFYLTYGNTPDRLEKALKLAWTQNVTILEACEAAEERAWYLNAALEHGWNKAELLRQIQNGAWGLHRLDEPEDICYTEEKETVTECGEREKDTFYLPRQYLSEPMAEYVMKDLVKKAGLESQFRIASAATSREEIGNPVYPPAQRKLAEHGIGCSCHAARQLVNSDYEKYDLLIGMDQANLRDMYRICGGDFADKMHLLLDYTDRPNREVADPWYTDNFEATWRDVSDGCQGLLDHLMIT